MKMTRYMVESGIRSRLRLDVAVGKGWSMHAACTILLAGLLNAVPVSRGFAESGLTVHLARPGVQGETEMHRVSDHVWRGWIRGGLDVMIQFHTLRDGEHRIFTACHQVDYTPPCEGYAMAGGRGWIRCDAPRGTLLRVSFHDRSGWFRIEEAGGSLPAPVCNIHQQHPTADRFLGTSLRYETRGKSKT